MKGHKAAQIARDAATNSQSDLFQICSSKMCWDAAIECQKRAGVSITKPVSTLSHSHVIDLNDTAVSSCQEMQKVPQGASLGFFRDNLLIHFMIAVGAGCAAGNKNECIGIGNPVGWEILNLAEELSWCQNGFKDPGHRLVQVRYRAI